MTSNARVSGRCTFAIAFLGIVQLAGAQPRGTGAAYEQGVNAFFAGQLSQAELFLSEAMQTSPQDPRVYYFRALSLLRQGRCDEAHGDMLIGAQLEAQGPRRYAVGAALERIQGHDRLTLEEFRRRARREVVQQTLATQRVTGPSNAVVPAIMNGSDAAVLRENHMVPLDELVRPGGPRTYAEPPLDTPPRTAPAPPAATEPPAKAGNADPFADDAPAATPAEPPGATAPAPAAAPESPLPTPPQGNPTPVETPPAAPAPPANPPVEAEENPFGG